MLSTTISNSRLFRKHDIIRGRQGKEISANSARVQGDYIRGKRKE
jgi:hypothetical protein